jgi:hypothetical protein
MGKYVELQSIDGHRLRAYVVEPATQPRAALVLLQEMDQRRYGWDSSRVKTTAASTSLPKHRRSLRDSHVRWEQKFVSTLPRAWRTDARQPLGTCSNIPRLSPRTTEMLKFQLGSGCISRVQGPTGVRLWASTEAFRQPGQWEVEK